MSAAKPQFKRFNPMPPAPTHNIYRVKLGGGVEGQITMNTFYYADEQTVGTATTSVLIELFNAFTGAGGILPVYAAAVSADWSVTFMLIDCPTSPTLSPYTVAPIQSGLGPVGHEPNQVATTIAKKTDWRGQHGRGRISVPALPTSWKTGTQLTTVVQLGNLASKMQTALTGATHTFTPGILARQTGAPNTLGWAPITSCVVRLILGTCRRRKPGVGK